jgi:undecaprenyl-diphosphatase
LNQYLLSVILGVIEGLTEFLPVSSTAHLRLAEEFMSRYIHAGISLSDPYWKMYTIVIQLGAILSLLAYFWKRIVEFMTTFPAGRNGRKTIITHPLSLTMIAFVVTAVPSLMLVKLIGKNLESLFVMGVSLLTGGVIMWIVDAIYGSAIEFAAGVATVSGGTSDAVVPIGQFRNSTTDVEDMSLAQSIWIGAWQITSAVFPGTSRSMATIAAGQTAGMTRASALEFSFLLSIPTMMAATGYELLKSVLHKGGSIGAAPANLQQWIVLAIGFVVSFIVAYGVVAWFMNYVRSRGFVPFAVYRILLGTAVLIWAVWR